MMKKAVILLLLGVFILGCTPHGKIDLPAEMLNPPQLTVDEYAVVDAGVDTPDHFEFMQRIPPDVRDAHTVWKYGNPDTLTETPNKILAPFGYRLQQNPIMSSYSFQLFKGDTMIVDGIANFFTPTENADGSDVALLMDLHDGGEKLLIRGSLIDWNTDGQMKSPPIYAGNKLITAYYDNGVVVTADGEKIFATPAKFEVEYPIKGLTAWQGRWVLEVSGKVYINGQSLNQALGYAEIFDWHLINGEPFYFFAKIKNGKVGISFAGRILNYEYDQVQHYLCCEPAAFNPGFAEHVTWFYGLREGKWYYVEMGVYE